MKTAVYSGSFNPLHIGHLAILRKLVGLFDNVLLVVSPLNPLKSSATAEDASSRLEAAKAAVAAHTELLDKVEVSDVEFRLPLPNYTINTLDRLRGERQQARREDELVGEASKDGKGCEDDSLVLVVGADQIADFRRWKDYRRILLEYGVAVFPREGFDIQVVCKDLLTEDPAYRIFIMDMPLVNVSSTQIRAALADGQDVSSLLF